MAEGAPDFDGMAVDGGSSQCIAAHHSNVPKFPPNNPLSPPELTHFFRPSKTQRKYDATSNRKMDELSDTSVNEHTAKRSNIEEKLVQKMSQDNIRTTIILLRKKRKRCPKMVRETTIGQHSNLPQKERKEKDVQKLS